MLAKEYAYKTVDGDPMQARIYTLDNGLTVYLTENHAEPVIQTMIAVRAGSQNDPLESTGLAHYQEHIMFKGTKSYGTTDYEKEIPNLRAIDSLYEVYGQTTDPARRKAIYHQIDSFSYENSKIAVANEFDKLMSAIGATGVNAYTSTDRTCYHEVIPATELTRWAMIESDRFQNLVIRGFHTELETVYEEFNMYATEDYDKVSLAIDQALFPNIPYRQHTVLGTQEDLKNPSLINIRKFYDTYYRPNNVAVCLSGDFDSDRAIEVIDAWFGNWKPQVVPAPKTY
ncbi:MAG: insulinase family protein, partial [Paludibacteraceae bacterium]|nr:insulinase family protein [Paludibacteraceae bacterium]